MPLYEPSLCMTDAVVNVYLGSKVKGTLPDAYLKTSNTVHESQSKPLLVINCCFDITMPTVLKFTMSIGFHHRCVTEWRFYYRRWVQTLARTKHQDCANLD